MLKKFHRLSFAYFSFYVADSNKEVIENTELFCHDIEKTVQNMKVIDLLI